MASINRVTLYGNVGRDPEIRNTQAGEPVASFSVATSEKWTDKSGQRKEATEWHRVVVFGKAAEIVRDYVKKGKPLIVEGSIHYSEYTAKDGTRKNSTEIRVSGSSGRVTLVGTGTGAAPKAEDGGAQEAGFSEEVPF